VLHFSENKLHNNHILCFDTFFVNLLQKLTKRTTRLSGMATFIGYHSFTFKPGFTYQSCWL